MIKGIYSTKDNHTVVFTNTDMPWLSAKYMATVVCTVDNKPLVVCKCYGSTISEVVKNLKYYTGIK